MLTLIHTTLAGGGGRNSRLLALGSLLALLTAALLAILPLTPAAADGHPDDLELALSIVDDSDNIVPPGSEFTVQAELRYSLSHAQERRPGRRSLQFIAAADSWLRLAGDLHWEETAFKRIDVAQQLVSFGAPLSGVDAAGAALGNTARMVARAADGRLIVARANTNKLYLFDAWNKRQVGIIDAPAGAHASTFGGGDTLSVNSRLRGVRSVAAWQQDENTWWVFAGSRLDTVGAHTQVGRLYVFRVDWTDAGVQVGAPTIIHPSADEFRNRYNADTNTEYGYTLNISRDGSTLAVVAPWANHMGAVYIYSRPDGEGQDWSDITHADAVKATPAVVPAWGTGVDATRPFTPTATGRTDASTDCDVWCSAVWAEVDVRSSELWWSTPHRIGLSDDGRVIAVGRPGKRYASTTPGGSFSSPKNNTGEIQVYVAPAGGWSAAPRADAGGRTLFATRTDASGFKPAQHYAAGPIRRVAATSAKLTILPWADTSGGHYFATAVDVSNDGAAVVTTAYSPAYAHVFQLDPGEEWSGDMVYTARLQASTHAGLHGGVEFSGDDRTIAMGDIHTGGNHAGEIFLHTRPADGVWADATLSGPSGRVVRSPEGAINGRRWGDVLYDLGGERLIISEYRRAGGALWLSDGGCAQRVADGLATWTCPIALPDPNVVVQSGVAEGPVTISGNVKVSVSGVAGSEITLRDTLELTVGEVDELAKVELDFDTNAATGRPYSGMVGPGKSTTLLLKLLNENDAASAKGAISSVLFTTSQGKLSAKLAAAADEACVTGGAVSCQIENAATSLTAGNSDKIRLTVEHPGAGKSGRSAVRATVIGIDGESFEAGPIELIFSGPASELAIAAPSRGLLSHDTCDAPSADGPEGCKIAADRDDRDLLTLQVTALDASGNPADVPTRAYIPAKVTGPDGKRVGSDKIAVTWPLRQADGNALDTSVDGAPQARINVNAPKTAQLPAGEYTVELSVDRLKTTQTFSISGPPAEVALSATLAELSVRDSFTVSATITDAGGAPVPDGTPVSWSATPIAAASTLVETASERRTKDGRAEASYLVVAPGRTTLRVGAGGITSVALVEVAGPPAPPVRLLDLLAAPYTQGSNIWFGTFSIRASALLRELPNAQVVHIWQSNRWYRYSQTEGEEESIDFTIHPNSILWFGDDN